MPTLYRISNAAQNQAAMLRTELLLARCRNCAPLFIDQPVDNRSRWQAEQQAHLLAWLDAGGFKQTDGAIENSGIAPLFSAPL